MFSKTHRVNPLPPLNLLMVIGEIGLILACAYFSTIPLRDPSPEQKLWGNEFGFLINSGAVASNALHETGSIPLWNPFVGSGEPLIETLFSYVLNPFMTFPILALGSVQGAKLALTIHILLAGIGGWSLGRTLGLHTPGRVLMGLIMAGSGSFSATMGGGFYQIGLSLAYLPWVMSGLIGTLYLNRRLPIAILAVSAALMVFAGTFWFVLPTAITAAFVTVFAVFEYDPATGRIVANARMVQRLSTAILLTLGLTAVRMIPQFNSGLVSHPPFTLPSVYDPVEIIGTYFQPIPVVGPDWWFGYHFILPAATVILVIVLRLAISPWKSPLAGGRWRLLAPAALAFMLFTYWAQEGTPLFRMLYETTFLSQWRWPLRIAASAAFWCGVVGTIWLDDIVSAFWGLARRRMEWTFRRGNATLRLPLGGLSAVMGIGLTVLALFSGLNVLQNWGIVCGVETVDRVPSDRLGLTYLRQQSPNGFFTVLTEGTVSMVTFWEVEARTSIGNPDVLTMGVPATIGSREAMMFMPQWGLGISDSYRSHLQWLRYDPVADSPRWENRETLWFNPNSPPYAFLAERQMLQSRIEPLTRQDVIAVDSFMHEYDYIRVTLDNYRAGDVLTLQEAAYPGWQVWVDGQRATLESVGGLIGVVLPDPAEGGTRLIEFSYRPPLLYLGAFVTLFAALIFVVYVLRLDEYIPPRYWQRIGAFALQISRQTGRVLTSPEVLAPRREGRTPSSPAQDAPLLLRAPSGESGELPNSASESQSPPQSLAPSPAPGEEEGKTPSL